MRPCQWLLCNQPTTGTGNKWAPPGRSLGEEGTGVRSRGRAGQQPTHGSQFEATYCVINLLYLSLREHGQGWDGHTGPEMGIIVLFTAWRIFL